MPTIVRDFFQYCSSRLVFLIFLAVATVFLGMSAYNVWETYTFIQKAQSSSGVVIGYERPNRGTNYPIVRFSANGQNNLEFTSGMSNDPPAFTVGEQVAVLYLPDSPTTSARINSWSQLWLIWVIFGGLGSIFYGIVFGGFFWQRLRSGSKNNYSESSAGADNTEDAQARLRQRMKEAKAQSAWSAKQNNRWLYVFPAVGILMLGLAGFLAWQHREFAATARQYHAVVIGYESGRRLYYPIFEFVNERGDTIHAFSNSGQQPPSHQIGEETMVYYDAQNNTATPLGWSEWLGTMIVGGIGMIFLLIGIPLVRLFAKM